MGCGDAHPAEADPGQYKHEQRLAAAPAGRLLSLRDLSSACGRR